MQSLGISIQDDRAKKLEVFREGMYRDRGLEAQIENLEAPLSPGSCSRMENRINKSGNGASREVWKDFTRKKGEAEARLSIAQDRRHVATKTLEEAIIQVVHVAPAALARAISCTFAFLACVGAEYVISLSIIGWLLNMDGTLLSHALALISVAALTGVEFSLGLVLIPHLINEKGHNESKVRRGLVYGLAVVSMVGNLWMVSTMADAREIAVGEKNRPAASEGLALEEDQQPSPTAPPETNEDAVINRFVLALALASCFDGALFSLIASLDFASLNARRRLNARIARLEKIRAGAQEELARMEQAAIEASQEERVSEAAAQDREEWISAMMSLLQLRHDFLLRRQEEQKTLQATFAQEEREEARKKLKELPLSAVARKVMRSDLDRMAFEKVN